MEDIVGNKYKVNNSNGEEVTVLHVEGRDCLLLRESGNLIKANDFYIKSNLIFWNYGDYADSSIFKEIMRVM